MENVPTIDNAETFHYVRVSKFNTPNFWMYVNRMGVPLPTNPYTLSMARSWCLGPMNTRIVYHRAGVTQDFSSPGRPINDNVTMYKRVNTALQVRTNELLDKVSNRCLEKIGRQSIPIYMMYRERKETATLLTKFVDKALFAVRNLRHPKRILWHYGIYDPQKHTGSFLKKLKKKTMSCETAGDAWLQYRFAWKPLIHDIQDSVAAAAEYEKKMHTFFVRSGEKFEHTESVDYYDSPLAGTDIWTGTRKGWIGMGVGYGFSDITLSALASFTNLPATVWDMVPWSFVIDRVVDISSYLDLYDATSGAAFTDGYRTQFFTTTTTPSSKSETYYPDIVSRFLVSSGRTYEMSRTHCPPREDVYMKREVLRSFPTPKLVYPMALKNEHLIDYAALLRQLRSRFKRRPA